MPTSDYISRVITPIYDLDISEYRKDHVERKLRKQLERRRKQRIREKNDDDDAT